MIYFDGGIFSYPNIKIKKDGFALACIWRPLILFQKNIYYEYDDNIEQRPGKITP